MQKICEGERGGERERERERGREREMERFEKLKRSAGSPSGSPRPTGRRASRFSVCLSCTFLPSSRFFPIFSSLPTSLHKKNLHKCSPGSRQTLMRRGCAQWETKHRTIRVPQSAPLARRAIVACNGAQSIRVCSCRRTGNSRRKPNQVESISPRHCASHPFARKQPPAACHQPPE